MKLICIYITILTLYFTIPVKAQELSSEKDQRVFTKEKGKFHVKQLNYDSAIYYVDERIKIDNDIKNESDLIVARSEKIKTLRLQNKYEEALRIALTTYDNYCGVDQKEENCEACSNLYNELYEFSILMKNYRQALEYLEMQCDKETNWLSYYFKKARIYIWLDMPDSALITTSACISLRKTENDPFRLIHAYNNHGLIAGGLLNKQDIAIATFNKATDIAEQNNDYSEIHAVVKGNLGSAYYEKKDYNRAYKYLLFTTKESHKKTMTRSFVGASIYLAHIEIEEKNCQLGINRLESLLNNYSSEELAIRDLEILELLMQGYKTLNNNSKYNLYLYEPLQFITYIYLVNLRCVHTPHGNSKSVTILLKIHM